MNRLLDIIFRREPAPEPDVPRCGDHGVEMRLRGKQGRPTRFEAQIEEEYTLIYFCPVEGCDVTASVKRVRSQIPFEGEAYERPAYARPDGR